MSAGRDRLAAISRLRAYLEVLPGNTHALGEIAYDERFRSEDWPRTVYAPQRADLDALFAERDAAVAEAGALRNQLAQARADALSEGIEALNQLWRLAPRSERAPGLNFAIGVLMAVRDRNLTVTPAAPATAPEGGLS
jgi:uncharacterized protein HemY